MRPQELGGLPPVRPDGSGNTNEPLHPSPRSFQKAAKERESVCGANWTLVQYSGLSHAAREGPRNPP